MSKTLFEKIWDKHVVDTLADGTIQLYQIQHYIQQNTMVILQQPMHHI